MKPTIGRIVHLHTASGAIYPAIVVTVHTDEILGLQAFMPRPNGAWFVDSVNWAGAKDIVDDTHSGQVPLRWDWPPRG